MDSLLMKLKDIRKVGELLEAVLTGDKDKLDKICKTIKELQKDIDDEKCEICYGVHTDEDKEYYIEAEINHSGTEKCCRTCVDEYIAEQLLYAKEAEEDDEKNQHKMEFPDHNYCEECDCCKGCECCECDEEDCCNMNCTNKATKFQNLNDPSCSITGDGRDWYCQKCYSDCVGDDDKE